MKKQLFFLFFLMIYLSYFVSAQSFSDFFQGVDLGFLSLLLVFVIFSVFISWILNRAGIFRDAYGNPTTATTVVSAAMAALIVIGWYKQGINLSYFFVSVGVPIDSLYLVFSVIVLIGIIFLIFRFGFGGVLFFGGVFLIAINYLTDFFYEKDIVYAVGAGAALIGLLMWNKTRKKMISGGKMFGRGLISGGKFAGEKMIEGGKFIRSRYDWEKEKRQWKAGTPVIFLGVLVMILGFLINQIIVIVVGAVLVLIGLLINSKTRSRMISAGKMVGRGLISGGKFIRSRYDWEKEKRQWKGRTHVLILGILVFILGLVLNQIYIMGVGVVLFLIGVWLWARKRPGLYRPLTPKYYPIQEKRQLKAGTPVMFLGALVVIFGFLINQIIVIAVGAVLVLIGLITRLRR
ncbi:MAG: hypothetical protein KatS3mg001_140 [Candidatus Pacearchaeota archaeon]|nr:MAG: hypothetical protein KatS3mg001_140 [Candidatus Pacearchaeota archaeon]